MRILAVAVVAALLSSCSTLGLSSYPASGPTPRWLLSGPIPDNFTAYDEARRQLSRGSKMFLAGAMVKATLDTVPGDDLQTIKEARRVKDSEEAIRQRLARKPRPAEAAEKICFIATLEHSTIDLAKASQWTFKVSLDGGEFTRLESVGNDDTPDYSVIGGATTWYSVGIYCGKQPHWQKAKSIRLNVFPPVFVNPGEAMLTWNIEG